MTRYVALCLATLALTGCSPSKPQQVAKPEAKPVGMSPLEGMSADNIGGLCPGWLLAVSPDGQRFAVYNQVRGTVRILSWTEDDSITQFTVDELPIRLYENSPHQAQFSPDGEYIAFDEEGWTGASTIYLGRPYGSLRLLHGAEDYADMVFSPDGKSLAALSPALQRWDLSTGKLMERPPEGELFSGPDVSFVDGSNGQLVYWIDGADDGPQTLVVRETFSKKVLMKKRLTNADGELNIPITLPGKPLTLIGRPKNVPADIALKFSPSGRYVGFRPAGRQKLIVQDSLSGQSICEINSSDLGTEIVSQNWWFVTDRLIAIFNRVFDVSSGKLAFTIYGDSVPLGMEVFEEDENRPFGIAKRALIVLPDGTCSSDPREAAHVIDSKSTLIANPAAVAQRLKELFAGAPVGRSSAMVPR
ncbi:MAG: WD40 repeat domain-containing protein [Fimbriimonadaceae bacterium]|nr:WD40 repeat domain-containing protein [Fimbriimonadaceae bacterium]